jgi:hypothetical protein
MADRVFALVAVMTFFDSGALSFSGCSPSSRATS